MSEFPERLTALRERRGMKRSVLAERCGLSKNMILRYETGEVQPTTTILEELAEVFDTSTDYLLGRTDYPGKYPEKILKPPHIWGRK